MVRTTLRDFAGTDAGKQFYRAYDTVLAKWPPGTTSTSIDSEYGTTHVNICGPENAPPVILLPGGGATSTVWFANVASLSLRNRVYAVDLMGDVGRSLNTGRPVTNIDDLLGWLHGVVPALTPSRPALVGHSYGAMIALAYALRYPNETNKLILIDPNSCFAGIRAHYLARAIPLLLRPNEKRQRAFIEWETQGAPIDRDWLSLLALGSAYFPTSKTVVPARPSIDRLSSLTAETSVILAGRSKIHDSAAVAAAIRETLPAARTTIVDAATHHTLPMAPARELDALVAASLDT